MMEMELAMDAGGAYSTPVEVGDARPMVQACVRCGTVPNYDERLQYRLCPYCYEDVAERAEARGQDGPARDAYIREWAERLCF